MASVDGHPHSVNRPWQNVPRAPVTITVLILHFLPIRSFLKPMGSTVNGGFVKMLSNEI